MTLLVHLIGQAIGLKTAARDLQFLTLADAALRSGADVERIKIIGRECPRIGAEFLEKMRQKLAPLLFRQEFEGEFIDPQSSAFSSEMIELALVDDFERFVT